LFRCPTPSKVDSRAPIPHQFGVLTFGGYETIHFGIRALFDLHINWVVMQIDIENAFNNIFQAVIFKDV